MKDADGINLISITNERTKRFQALENSGTVSEQLKQSLQCIVLNKS